MLAKDHVALSKVRLETAKEDLLTANENLGPNFDLNDDELDR